MGRFVLLIVAAAVLGSIALTAGRPDLAAAGQERESQSAALARGVAASAHAAAVGDMVDPATRRFRSALTLPAELRFGPDRARVDDYHLEASGTEAVVTVTGFAGGVAHQVTSRYRLALADFPGPLWIAAPVAVATVSPAARIAGTAPDGTTRPAYFDATRFADYRLAASMSLPALDAALAGQLRRAGAGLSVQTGMAAVIAQTGAPTLAELYGRAMTAMGPADRTFGAHVVSGTETYGNFDDADDPSPRIVRVVGPLTVPAGATLSGNGILVVEGDLTVAGTLRWDGFVLVTTPAQRVAVRLPGTVEVRGSLMVDQEAPPPGGHTDLTVNRDLSGAWPTPAGEAGQYPWALRHTHRIEATVPSRTFTFAGPGASAQEGMTRFGQTLAAAGGPVYLRIVNHENHGASSISMRLGATDYTASAAAGFPPSLARSPSDPYATRTFAPAELQRLVVQVRSLRLLAHLTNGEASGVLPSMAEWMSGGRCSDRPACVGQVAGRDAALGIEIVRASTGRPVYDASLYWHTKEPGHGEHAQEAAADAAWRASLAAGTTYGTLLEVGAGTRLSFSVPRMAPIAARLGLVGASVAHVGSSSRHWIIGESAASSDRGTDAGVTVCAAGVTQTLEAAAARAAVRRGATLGACGA